MGTGGSLSPLSPEFCQRLVQSFVLLALAASLYNRSLRLGNSPHIRACSSIRAYPENRTSKLQHPANQFSNFPFGLNSILWIKSSTDWYHQAPNVTALPPMTYHLVVFQGSYFFRMGHFFLRWASRLDAFSVYPIRISLPCCAVGTTTVAPVMRPLRSSRTRSSSSHVSYAHDG